MLACLLAQLKYQSVHMQVRRGVCGGKSKEAATAAAEEEEKKKKQAADHV
jgi:hypothetical protein